MAGPRLYPKGCQLWPSNAVDLSIDQVIKAYDAGLVGAFKEPEEAERFDELIVSSGGSVDGSDITHANGFAESGAGKLSIPYVWAMLFFPGCLPGAGQDVGDCVSHSEKNANMFSYGAELFANKPDEITGKIEAAPGISATGLKAGAFSTEVVYWWRGRDSHGWSCDASSQVAMKKAGLVTRDNHPGIGIDLTTYSGKKASAYGRTPPPAKVADAIDDNLIRQATRAKSREERRDFIANGYSIHTCGMEGYSNKRDKNGVSKRSGSWAHAMAQGAFDDRQEIKSIYSDSLELVQNSWSIWNSGPRDIFDSVKFVPDLCNKVMARFALSKDEAMQKLHDCDILNKETGSIMIPPGSFWSTSKDWGRRECIVKSSVNGFPAREISLGFAGNV